MIDLDSQALVESVNSRSDFEEQTRWFDGSILFEFGDQQLWLKIYDGEVIDTLPEMSPLGYTFKVTGDEEAWRAFFDGERTFMDLINAAEEIEAQIWFEGNMTEARRMHEATFQLVEEMKGVINQ